MTLSTHVLDTALGRPAAGVPLSIERWAGDAWTPVSSAVTGPEGRATDLVPADQWEPGRWRLLFDTAAYLGDDAFFPGVTVEFRTATSDHHHVPLLLSPYGFSTYRGT